MKARKTIEIEKLVDDANHYLKTSYDVLSEQRKGVAHFVADILHYTGNYEGFNYLDSESDLNAGMYGKDGRIFFYK